MREVRPECKGGAGPLTAGVCPYDGYSEAECNRQAAAALSKLKRIVDRSRL